jgi:DNA-binding FrmR family transcriptional regulator
MSAPLIHRLSRIQGQIEALKKTLQAGAYEQEACLNNLRLLKASINGLKKFGALYVEENIQKCLAANKNPQDLQPLISSAINASFDL